MFALYIITILALGGFCLAMDKWDKGQIASPYISVLFLISNAFLLISDFGVISYFIQEIKNLTEGWGSISTQLVFMASFSVGFFVFIFYLMLIFASFCVCGKWIFDKYLREKYNKYYSKIDS